MSSPHFICPFTGRHLGFFYLLADVNNAAMRPWQFWCGPVLGSVSHMANKKDFFTGTGRWVLAAFSSTSCKMSFSEKMVLLLSLIRWGTLYNSFRCLTAWAVRLELNIMLNFRAKNSSQPLSLSVSLSNCLPTSLSWISSFISFTLNLFFCFTLPTIAFWKRQKTNYKQILPRKKGSTHQVFELSRRFPGTKL